MGSTKYNKSIKKWSFKKRHNETFPMEPSRGKLNHESNRMGKTMSRNRK